MFYVKKETSEYRLQKITVLNSRLFQHDWLIETYTYMNIQA